MLAAVLEVKTVVALTLMTFGLVLAALSQEKEVLTWVTLRLLLATVLAKKAVELTLGISQLMLAIVPEGKTAVALTWETSGQVFSVASQEQTAANVLTLATSGRVLAAALAWPGCLGLLLLVQDHPYRTVYFCTCPDSPEGSA